MRFANHSYIDCEVEISEGLEGGSRQLDCVASMSVARI